MAQPKEDTRPVQRFRLKAGNHIGPDLTQEKLEIKNSAGEVVQTKHPSRTWVQGDIVEAKEDLVKIGGDAKFELLGKKSKKVVPVTPTEDETEDEDEGEDEDNEETDGLEYRTVAQLKVIAEQRKVDLKGARTKEEMVNAIRAAGNAD